MPPDEEVVDHRHVREDLGMLERAPQADGRHLPQRDAGDFGPVEQDLPRSGSIDAVDAVEQGRLPGAIRPTTANSSDAATDKLTRSTAVTPPKRSVRSRTSRVRPRVLNPTTSSCASTAAHCGSCAPPSWRRPDRIP